MAINTLLKVFFDTVAVSYGYDTCFAVKTCAGLYHFGESLVIRFHSEIDQINLSTVAQCVTTLLPLGDCHSSMNHRLTWSSQAQSCDQQKESWLELQTHHSTT